MQCGETNTIIMSSTGLGDTHSPRVPRNIPFLSSSTFCRIHQLTIIFNYSCSLIFQVYIKVVISEISLMHSALQIDQRAANASQRGRSHMLVESGDTRGQTQAQQEDRPEKSLHGASNRAVMLTQAAACRLFNRSSL